eukprot:1815853-Prymnesium_polylepis.1
MERPVNVVLEGGFRLVLEERAFFLPRQNGAGGGDGAMPEARCEECRVRDNMHANQRPDEAPEPAHDAYPASKLNLGFGRTRDVTWSRRQLDVTLGLLSRHAVLLCQPGTRLLAAKYVRQLALEERDARLGSPARRVGRTLGAGIQHGAGLQELVGLIAGDRVCIRYGKRTVNRTRTRPNIPPDAQTSVPSGCPVCVCVCAMLVCGRWLRPTCTLGSLWS